MHYRILYNRDISRVYIIAKLWLNLPETVATGPVSGRLWHIMACLSVCILVGLTKLFLATNNRARLFAFQIFDMEHMSNIYLATMQWIATRFCTIMSFYQHAHFIDTVPGALYLYDGNPVPGKTFFILKRGPEGNWDQINDMVCRPGGHYWYYHPGTLSQSEIVQFIWRSGTHIFHLRVHNLQIGVADTWRHQDDNRTNGPACISNHMPSKVWGEITYPFANFNGCTVEVREYISNFIPNYIIM